MLYIPEIRYKKAGYLTKHAPVFLIETKIFLLLENATYTGTQLLEKTKFIFSGELVRHFSPNFFLKNRYRYPPIRCIQEQIKKMLKSQIFPLFYVPEDMASCTRWRCRICQTASSVGNAACCPDCWRSGQDSESY